MPEKYDLHYAFVHPLISDPAGPYAPALLAEIAQRIDTRLQQTYGIKLTHATYYIAGAIHNRPVQNKDEAALKVQEAGTTFMQIPNASNPYLLDHGGYLDIGNNRHEGRSLMGEMVQGVETPVEWTEIVDGDTYTFNVHLVFAIELMP